MYILISNLTTINKIKEVLSVVLQRTKDSSNAGKISIKT